MQDVYRNYIHSGILVSLLYASYIRIPQGKTTQKLRKTILSVYKISVKLRRGLHKNSDTVMNPCGGVGWAVDELPAQVEGG